MMPELEVVKALPVSSLSLTSMQQFLACPEKWKRIYIDNEYEAKSTGMILGGAGHDALQTNFKQKIESKVDLPADEVAQLFVDEWDHAVDQAEEGVNWDKDKPGQVKDRGVEIIKRYIEVRAPALQPDYVERKVQFHYPGADWTFSAYLDFEAGIDVRDFKIKRRKMSAEDAEGELQPMAYSAARKALDSTLQTRFSFEVMQPPTSRSPLGMIYDIPVPLLDRQVDRFQMQLLQVAREIAWRTEYDIWHGAVPWAWWCAQSQCGFWGTCPWRGGA